MGKKKKKKRGNVDSSRASETISSTLIFTLQRSQNEERHK